MALDPINVRWRKRLFKGIHQPLINQELFEVVRKRPKRGHKVACISKKYFPFRGLLRCGNCGCVFTAETKIPVEHYMLGTSRGCPR